MSNEKEKLMLELAEAQKIFDEIEKEYEDEADIFQAKLWTFKIFDEIEKEYEDEADNFWNNLSQEKQQLAFFSVMSRLVKGELRDRGTYRYVLYDVFGFDSSSYFVGMKCGYMELHNSIYTQEEMRELRDRELAAAGVKVITSKVIKKEEKDE